MDLAHLLNMPHEITQDSGHLHLAGMVGTLLATIVEHEARLRKLEGADPMFSEEEKVALNENGLTGILSLGG